MRNTIFHQDCIAGMREHLPDACVDVIVTSPPYNIGVQYNTHRDDMPFEGYLDWMGELAVECCRVLNERTDAPSSLPSASETITGTSSPHRSSEAP